MATSALAVEVPLPVGSSDAAAAELLAVRADAQPAMASIATGRAAPAVAGPDAPMRGGGCSASAPGDVVRHTPVHAAATTFEPLKVCLDDDSSIEDSDEDMFDDDAFTFGDDDFLALNEAMKRAAMMKSLPHCNDYQSAATTSSAPAGPAQNSYLPLHQHSPASSPISEKAPISTDSSPSTSQVRRDPGGRCFSAPCCFHLCVEWCVDARRPSTHENSEESSHHRILFFV